MEVKRIQEQLRRAHEGPAWHGPAVRMVLEGVAAEKAAAKPIAAAHSIWEIVQHIIAWQRAVTERLQGKVRRLTDEEDWPRIDGKDEAAWKRTTDLLENSYGQAQDAIARLDDAQLDQKATGEQYSNYVMIHGLIQHNLFHAGQISLLRKG